MERVEIEVAFECTLNDRQNVLQTLRPLDGTSRFLDRRPEKWIGVQDEN
jgi:hypothetical protein